MIAPVAPALTAPARPTTPPMKRRAIYTDTIERDDARRYLGVVWRDDGDGTGPRRVFVSPAFATELRAREVLCGWYESRLP